jgi:hypothetical protein
MPDDAAKSGKRGWRGRLASVARSIWRITLFAGRVVALIIVPALVVLAVGFFLLRTDRDVSYRYSAAQSDACNYQRANAAALATGSDRAETNDEIAAIERDPRLREALTCALQLHEIPRPEPVRLPDGKLAGPLRFHLAFLEYTEAGEPADTSIGGRTLEADQLDGLLEHLRTQRREGKANFVIVFIHGWRHDARIGDSDLQKLRLFAAYTASFLEQRCAGYGRDCNTAITAIYVGWRGARVDESYFARKIGSVGRPIDFLFGQIPAYLTLFDRKPVSERIGPAAVTSLRRVDAVVFDRHEEGWKRDLRSRMITFGHSLGGNMLAAILREPLIERIARHRPGNVMVAPFGDLIVLLNPASEASNWTTVQRAVRERTRFMFSLRNAGDEADIKHEAKEIEEGHQFFPAIQKPTYISLGSANFWPAGGLRKADAKYLWELANRRSTSIPKAEQTVRKAQDAAQACAELSRRAEILDRPHYDWATHDLFPAFKWDFRPFAQTLEALARNRTAADICELGSPTPPAANDADEQTNWFFLAASGLMRNFPFMNTDVEQTRTIGNLNPMRSPIGSLARGNLQPATNYGTTHELIVNLGAGGDDKFLKATYYSASIPSHSECAVVDGWLLAARRNASPNGMYWDSGFTNRRTAAGESGNLTPVRRRSAEEWGRVESQFRHGFGHSGMAPIVRANDPFWNVRVFETAMQEHSGYDSYPLICATMQLIIDDIVSVQPASPAEVTANKAILVPSAE